MLPEKPSPEQIALNRVTFGARDRDILGLQQTGWQAWLDDQLRPPFGDDPALDQYLRSVTMHIDYPAYDFGGVKWDAHNEERPLQYLWTSPSEMWRLNKDVLFRSTVQEQLRPFEELCSAVYIRNTHSKYQLREVMADFWHNHFSVYSNKGYQIRDTLISYDRDVIRPNVFGNFRQMLEAVASSTTMLIYLDNADSEALQPNENYARELMELHTMGRDVYYGKNPEGVDYSAKGFRDDDVVQASRAFSGWTFKRGFIPINGTLENNGAFFFNPFQHNDQAGRCLGFDLSNYRGLSQGRKVLDLVAAHPATAAFVTGKICRHFFGENPPPAVLARAAAAWTANRDKSDQIGRVLRAILSDGDEIFQGPQTKVRRPHERMIALARVTDAEVKPHLLWRYLLSSISDSPFGWATPDGRPDTSDFWLNSATNVGIWNQLQYATYSENVHADFYTQTPENVIRSAIATTEFWVGRVIGYRLSTQAMNALINATARSIQGYYISNPVAFNANFGTIVISTLATAPEFVYH